jgi:microcystin-dependent protein
MPRVLLSKVSITGEVKAFAGATPPEGWLLCDGSTVSRSQYPELFAAIGTIHGQGNGATTFHLPDYRGRFLRGADDMGTGAAGRDPDASIPGGRTAANTGGATGAEVGSVQSHTMQGHNHQFATGRGDGFGFSTGSGVVARSVDTSSFYSNYTTTSTSGSETRPQNANVNYIIKV